MMILLALHTVSRSLALATAVLFSIVAIWTGADLCCTATAAHSGDAMACHSEGSGEQCCHDDAADDDHTADIAVSCCSDGTNSSDGNAHRDGPGGGDTSSNECAACSTCCLCSASVLHSSVFASGDLVPSQASTYFLVLTSTVSAAYDVSVPPPNNA